MILIKTLSGGKRFYCYNTFINYRIFFFKKKLLIAYCPSDVASYQLQGILKTRF